MLTMVPTIAEAVTIKVSPPPALAVAEIVIACNSMTVTVVKSRREVLWAPVLTVLDRAGVALFIAVSVVMDWEWP